MTQPIRFFIFAGLVLAAPALVGTYACNSSPRTETKSETQTKPETQSKPETPATPLVLTDAEQQAGNEFEKRTKDYAVIHQTLEGTIPTLPDNATAEQIQEHKQAMAAMIQKERQNAQPGEFFTPDVVALVVRILGATLDGASGKDNKESAMDENPGRLPDVGVNDRYPDGIPISSMPSELLEQLPELPEKMEYRFLGKRLVLVDSCASVVLDITPNVMP